VNSHCHGHDRVQRNREKGRFLDRENANKDSDECRLDWRRQDSEPNRCRSGFRDRCKDQVPWNTGASVYNVTVRNFTCAGCNFSLFPESNFLTLAKNLVILRRQRLYLAACRGTCRSWCAPRCPPHHRPLHLLLPLIAHSIEKKNEKIDICC
jgi:hypothetical protein